MNVLSVCDGMSCGQIALKELGIPVSKYYASEIDKFAGRQTKHNFPDTIQLGDMVFLRYAMTWKKDITDKFYNSEWISEKTKKRFKYLRGIDWKSINLVIGGTPCQGFSFAGKQLAFSDPRSKLFFDFIKILNHIKRLNPDVKFLLENVNMKKIFLDVISEHCGVYPVRINSRLVSAQNRDRFYWTNIKTRSEGIFFQETYADIPQPKDEGLLLRDILEKDVSEKYYLSDKILSTLLNRPIEYKFKVVDGSSKSGYIRKDVAKMGTTDTYKIDRKGNPKPNQDKASCFTAGANSGGNHSDMDLICVAMRGRDAACLSPKRTESRKNIQQLEPRTDGKTNTITSVQKDNLVIQLNTSKESGGKQPYQHNRIYSDEGKNIYTNHRIRRLTPIEVSRLQTVPDWYEWVVSDTQIYKMCGNGWTVKVITWILGFLKN